MSVRPEQTTSYCTLLSDLISGGAFTREGDFVFGVAPDGARAVRLISRHRIVKVARVTRNGYGTEVEPGVVIDQAKVVPR